MPGHGRDEKWLQFWFEKGNMGFESKQEDWALTNEIGVKEATIEVEGWKGENMFGDGLIQLNCTS